MPGETEKVAELEGQVSDLEAQITDLTKKLETATGSNERVIKAVELQGQINELTAKVTELTKTAETAKAAAEKAEAEKAEAVLKASMSTDEQDYCKAMSADQRKEFMAKPADERSKLVNKRASDDEIIKVGDVTIRKSVVGADQFAVIKSQQAQLDKAEKAVVAERTAREDVEFKKRADDSYKHVPGSVDERAGMLRAISKMDEPLRKSFEAVFEASEKLAAAGFARVGHGDGGKTPPGGSDDATTKAYRDFETKVTEIAGRDKIGKSAAMAKARKEHPALFASYQEASLKAQGKEPQSN